MKIPILASQVQGTTWNVCMTLTIVELFCPINNKSPSVEDVLHQIRKHAEHMTITPFDVEHK